jgi:transposase
MTGVMEALRGASTIADICRKRQISQTLFYRWWDKFLEPGKQGLTDRNGIRAEPAFKARIFKLIPFSVFGFL